MAGTVQSALRQGTALAGNAALRALHLVYPPQCAACGERTEDDFALCAGCWPGAGFIAGLVCDLCGTPLPGEDTGEAVHCDDCLTISRPWARGRAALVYGDTARRVVLALKHGDRTDLARPAALWMARAARPILLPGMLAAPVPLHRSRLFRRRYNQAALLGARVARETGIDWCPDLLERVRATGSQEGRDRDGRFENLQGAIRPHPRRGAAAQGRPVLLIDDVMTSGATLAAAADACLAAGATAVSVLVLARVAKQP